MDLKDTIQLLYEKYYPDIIAIRRYIHKNSELSFQEFNTSKFICSKLNEYGIPYKSGYVKTGIVGVIKGKNPDKMVIALRADMDALPIEESGDNHIKSINK